MDILHTELRNWLKENDAIARGDGEHWNLRVNHMLGVAGLFRDDPCKCERNPRSQAGTEKDRQERL